MKSVNSYNNFKNNKLKQVSLIDNDSSITNNEFKRYQKEYYKILKHLNINMHYSSSYKLSMSSLFILIKNILDKDNIINIENNIENIVIITTCAVSLIVREDKDNTGKLVSYANQKGIKEQDINKIMYILLSLKRIFNDVAKNFGKKIELITDMLSYTELFIPFVYVLLSIIKNDLIDINYIFNKLFKDIIDDIKYKIVLNRILHKLFIIINNNNKFQNVKNSNILKINNDLKSPMYKKLKIQFK